MNAPAQAQQVALVTGASRGIGRAIALLLAERGFKVIGTATSDSGSAAIGEALAPFGGLGLTLNVTDAAALDAAIDGIVKQHGGLHVLVNNAGITRDARLQKMTIEQFDAVIDVNLRAVFHCAQAVADTMVAQGAGVILNASSVVGIYGNFGQTNYAATKFGVIGFTKTWSRELGPKGVRVNAVAPGFIETPILSTIPDKVMDQMRAEVPLRRLGRPEEIANVYAFLASDEASYVNGAVLEVAGGLTV